MDPNVLLLGPLLASSAIAGVPYALLALLILRWGRGKGGRQWRRASYWAPVLFLPLLVVWAALQTMWSRGTLSSSDSGFAIVMCVYGLAVGYLYVGAVALLAWVGTRLGWVEPVEVQ